MPFYFALKNYFNAISVGVDKQSTLLFLIIRSLFSQRRYDIYQMLLIAKYFGCRLSPFHHQHGLLVLQ